MPSSELLSEIRELTIDMADMLSLLQFEKAGMNSEQQTEVELGDLLKITRGRLEKLRAQLPSEQPRFQRGDLVTHVAMPGVGKFWAYGGHQNANDHRWCRVDATSTDPMRRMELSVADLRPYLDTPLASDVVLSGVVTAFRKMAIVEAFQLTEESVANFNSWPQWLQAAHWRMSNDVESFFRRPFSDNAEWAVRTRLGIVVLKLGDWVIYDEANSLGRLIGCLNGYFEKGYVVMRNLKPSEVTHVDQAISG